MKKGFIFDLDGVIVDTAKFHFLAWQRLAHSLDIEFNATTNVVALSLDGNGSYGFADGAPSITNNAGTGVDGDIYFENDAACTGYVILRMRKSAGFTSL